MLIAFFFFRYILAGQATVIAEKGIYKFDEVLGFEDVNPVEINWVSFAAYKGAEIEYRFYC